MLEELLKYNKLGNKDEVLHFLFNGVSEHKQFKTDIKRHLCSSMFSIGQSFEGVVEICAFGSLIEVKGDYLKINKVVFKRDNYDQNSYLNHYHFYNRIFFGLRQAGAIEKIFNENNLRYSISNNQYYLLEDKFPFGFYLLRNLFLSCKFLDYKNSFPNRLFINKIFTCEFEKDVIHGIELLKKKKRKNSLKQLKRSLENKEKAGKEAEVFVLNYEKCRLIGHKNIGKVEKISDEDTTAGYDIQSFNDIESVFMDRFIEVKSYYKEVSFYWSKNEVEKSMELGDNYFLYLVDRSKFLTRGYTPKIFQNPYIKLFKNEYWKKEVENWKFTQK